MMGKRLGHWVIDEELGRGGMGKVYLAHEDPPASGAGRQAAVKVLAPELSQDPGFLHRFQREVEVLSKLDHPNIVHFFDAGTQDGHHYYAMEYVAGESFDEILQERGRLPWKEVLDVALQVCAALKHAHNHGIIHRDLKPPNLMRSEAGAVKLTDFGIAKLFAARQLTAAGALVGTAEYLSPEQAEGKAITNRSDLYSLGVVLYVMLTGRTPFEGKTVLELLHKHRFGQFDPPRRVVTEVPYELDELVCNLMEKDPAARPANAMVLQRRLESMGRQLERKEQRTFMSVHNDATQVEQVNPQAGPAGGPGPATLMSHLMREELEKQQRGSTLAQLFNQPWVVAPLFLLCVGLLVWRFWPQPRSDPERVVDEGVQLMDSERPRDWVGGWDLLQSLTKDQLNALPKEKRDSYEEKKEIYREQAVLGRALDGVPRAKAGVSEAQRLYKEGLRRCREDNPAAAITAWEEVVRKFADDPSEERWVALARKALDILQEKGYPR